MIDEILRQCSDSCMLCGARSQNKIFPMLPPFSDYESSPVSFPPHSLLPFFLSLSLSHLSFATDGMVMYAIVILFIRFAQDVGLG